MDGTLRLGRLQLQRIRGLRRCTIPKLTCPIQADPPGFGGDRGEKRAAWRLQLGRSTICVRCRSWRSDCVQKNGDVEFATIPSHPHVLWRPRTWLREYQSSTCRRPSQRDAPCGETTILRARILPDSKTSRRLSPLARVEFAQSTRLVQQLRCIWPLRETIPPASQCLVCCTGDYFADAGPERATGWQSLDDRII